LPQNRSTTISWWSLGDLSSRTKPFLFIDYEGLREVGVSIHSLLRPTANDILFYAPVPVIPLLSIRFLPRSWRKKDGLRHGSGLHWKSAMGLTDGSFATVFQYDASNSVFQQRQRAHP